jgi:hypothetical protein
VREDFRPLYWTMLGLGAAAVLILAVGFATLLRFAPPGERTGTRAHVVGVFPYDPGTGQVEGAPSTHFARDQPFAAEVDWQRLPSATIVSAEWFDSLDSQVGQVGPAAAGELAGRQAVVAVRTPPEFHANLPGTYTLIVVRYSRGQPVEVLATDSVVVLSNT